MDSRLDQIWSAYERRAAEDSSDLDAARRARLRGTPFQDVTRRPERRTRPSHRDPTGDTAIRRIDKEKK